MTPTDHDPPPDHEVRMPIHFIKTGVARGTGILMTGASTGISFIETLDPLVTFGARIVALLVGVATLASLCLSIAEKWRKLRVLKGEP